MRSVFRRLQREPLIAFSLIVAAAALAYLPFVSQLGFYNDDWFTLVSRVSGVGLLSMQMVDRPVMGLVYSITYSILGDTPLPWHLFAFLVRALGGLAFLWLLRLMWPEQRRFTLTAALLFIVYPGFLQQPSANNYSNHLIALLIGLVSLGLGVKAIQCAPGKKQKILVILSAGLVLIYPLIYEAMLGLEGLRLILYWFVLSNPIVKGLKPQVRRLISRTAPYLVAVALVLAFRLVVFQGWRPNTDSVGLMTQYLKDPLGMGLKVIFETGRDFFETVAAAWFVPVNKLAAQAGILEILIPIALAGIIGSGLWFYIRRTQPQQNNFGAENAGRNWLLQALWIGGLGTLVTLLPVALSGRSVDFSYSMDRYTLQSSAAAAILVAALLFSGKNSWLRWGGFGLLLSLALVTHFNNAVYYRDHWRNQQQLWWQLAERVPQIKPDTPLIVLLPEGYRQAEGFPVFGMANEIYYPGTEHLKITGEVLNPQTVPEIVSEKYIVLNWRRIVFTREYDKSLIVTYPSAATCVHVLDGQNLELSSLEDPLAWQVGSTSHIDRIDPNAAPKIPPVNIIGPAPAENWCTYFQQASLARQKEDWAQVIRLGDLAAEKGYLPNDLSEYMPFIDGYAHLGRRDDARRLANLAKKDALLVHSVCTEERINSPAGRFLCYDSN